MHPAILQTNRAIYAEAARQLYAKTYIEKGFGHDVKQGEQNYGANIPYVAWAVITRNVYRSMARAE